jgi:hypothetical protein
MGGERSGVCRVLVRKQEEKRPIRRPRCNNTKKDLLKGR